MKEFVESNWYLTCKKAVIVYHVYINGVLQFLEFDFIIFVRIGARKRLESVLTEAGNDFCADCGAPDPKWV